MLTLELLQRMWPHGDSHVTGLVEAIASQAPDVFPRYGIDSDLVVAHFMAQWSEECGAGIEVTENMNYSAQGLMRTWPTRFGRDRANKFAHNPQMIAEAVYGGRMGNAPPPSHDGWDFRGRGLSQLTGRENYERVGEALKLDLADEPDLANDPAHALEVAVYDTVQVCHCLEPARGDDVVAVTRALNGGLIGLPDRRAWLKRWKVALGAS